MACRLVFGTTCGDRLSVAFVAPLTVGSLYFIAGQIIAGIAWSVHLWLGSIVMMGVVGLLISYVSAPPQVASGTIR